MQQHERAVISKMISDALALGYVVSIWEGEGWAIKRSADKAAILAACASTDSDNFIFRDASGERVGAVLVVYGNDAGETIADNTDNEAINALLKGAEELQERQAA